MTTAARPGQFTGATDNSANGGLFTDTKIDGIPDLISADVLAAQTAATNAATSETNAATSSGTATTQASNASTSASGASTSASEALASKNAASTSAGGASTSAGTATTKAAAANTSAVNAAASENAAAGSATSASTSASTATSQANTATTRATAAGNSATAASNSATAAAASFDSFDDRYLGAKSSAPSTDNDGNALLTGALYFNSSSNQIFSWTGSAWIAIKPTSSEQTNINALSASAVVADMAILATDAIVADMAILGTNDVVADMAILGTNDVVTDMNVLGTADVVNDMNVLGSSATVTAMNLLGTSAVVTDMGILATTDVVADMNTLATADIVTDMNLLGTSANVAAMGLLGVSGVITDMGILGTAAIVEDMGILGTSANVTAMSNVSGSIGNVNTVASNIGSVNNFSSVYRISSSAPSDSLNSGDLYFNTSTNVLNVYGASGWQNAGSSVNGTSERFHYDITGTPTSVSGADANNNTLAYDAGFIDVYLNGVRMSPQDITVSSGSAVVFGSALAAGDEVDIVTFGTFSVANINASNLSSGTVPNARFPSTLPAVSGVNLTALNANNLGSGTVPIARIGSGTKNNTTFLRGDNTFQVIDLTALSASNLTSGTVPNARFPATLPAISGANLTNLDATDLTGTIASARVAGSYTGITGTGTLNAGSITSGFGAIDNGASAITSTGVGSFGSLDISGDIDVDGVTNLDVVDIDGAVDMATTALVTGVLTANGGAVFNEGGADVNFRVESDTLTHALFVDGANGNVGISNGSPNRNLHISGGAADVAFGITNSATGTAATDGFSITIENPTPDVAIRQRENNNMKFLTNNTERMRIHNNGVVSASAGVALGVGTANTASNVLDDYEEGTWTPAIVGLSNTPNFHNKVGRYTKIGRVCTVQFFAQTAGGPNPTFSNANAVFTISGLPFSVYGHGYTGSQGSLSAQSFNFNGGNNTYNVTGQVSPSVNASEQMEFQVTASGGIRGQVKNSGQTSGFIIEATVTYFTSD